MSETTADRPPITEKSHVQGSSLIGSTKLVLMTATELETAAVFLELKPPPGETELIRIVHGSQSFTFGTLGAYNVAHVQCAMGATGFAASMKTTSDAVGFLNARAVVMVGIAFGSDTSKQAIGDVIISEYVIPYNTQKVSASEIIPRGAQTPAGAVLLNRFRTHVSDTHYEFKIQVGPLLSGETLIDNLEYRNSLLKLFPQSVGGEMEGAGVASACHTHGVEWLLVKGICDFADGNKSINKVERQQAAIKTALSVCRNVFSAKNAFTELGLELALQSFGHPVGDVLFTGYTNKCSDYYFERQIDETIAQEIKDFDLWISGTSGIGKTTLLLRHLEHEPNVHYVPLGSTIGTDAKGTLGLMCFEINSRFSDITFGEWKGLTLPEMFRTTAQSASVGIRTGSPQSFYIDEIPLSGSELKEFTVGAMAFMIQCRQVLKDKRLRLFFSSINSVTEMVDQTQAKVRETMVFRTLAPWSLPELSELCGAIAGWLKLEMSSNEIAKLSANADGSPRYVKRFFRNRLTSPGIEFAKMLAQTTSDLES